MKFKLFLIEIAAPKSSIYNARTALRKYLQWNSRKKLKKEINVDDVDVTEIEIDEASIAAFSAESRTNRNHAVLLRKILNYQLSLDLKRNKVPAYQVHAYKVTKLKALVEASKSSTLQLAKTLNITEREMNRIMMDWSHLSPKTAKDIDDYAQKQGENIGFSSNLPIAMRKIKSLVTQKVQNSDYEDLPQCIREFVTNVGKFLKGNRANYEDCDTGHSVRNSTADGIIQHLKNYFKFCVFDIHWFIETYKEEFEAEFKAVSILEVLSLPQDYTLLFDKHMMKLYARFYLPFKSFYKKDDLDRFKASLNTSSSVTAIQSIRTLFNSNGYIALAAQSRTIREELKLTPEEILGWEEKCLSVWIQFKMIDKVCRSKQISMRPRNINTEDDHGEMAILKNVLSLPRPSDAIFDLNDAIRDLMDDIDPTSKEHRKLRQVLLASKFLMALPLRKSNLMDVVVTNDPNLLDKEEKKAFIRFTDSPENFKIFVHSSMVKNGDSLRSIDRSLPKFLVQLFKEHFPNVKSGQVTKLIDLSDTQLNGYLNSLSLTLLPDLFPKGLTVHCYRHIVASTIVILDPNGYSTAAQLLHDSVSEVEKTYGYRRQDQHVGAYYDHDYLKEKFG